MKAEQQHTITPWEERNVFHGSSREIIAGGKRIALVIQYAGDGKRVTDFEECKANAELIASAPTLKAENEALKAKLQNEITTGRQEWERLQFSKIDELQALNKELVEALEHVRDFQIDGYYPFMDTVRLLITKATK